MSDISKQKRQLRTSAKIRRSEAFESQASDAAARLAAFGKEFATTLSTGIVSAYYPYETEIDSMGLLRELENVGWKVALPVVVGKERPLEFRAWQIDTPLVNGVFGIPIPGPESDVLEPDLLFVPMLAYDRGGYRLGYGGGFYDRTLERLRGKKAVCAVGLAFAAQQVDKCPIDSFDQPLDGVLTENGLVMTKLTEGQA